MLTLHVGLIYRTFADKCPRDTTHLPIFPPTSQTEGQAVRLGCLAEDLPGHSETWAHSVSPTPVKVGTTNSTLQGTLVADTQGLQQTSLQPPDDNELRMDRNGNPHRFQLARETLAKFGKSGQPGQNSNNEQPSQGGTPPPPWTPALLAPLRTLTRADQPLDHAGAYQNDVKNFGDYPFSIFSCANERVVQQVLGPRQLFALSNRGLLKLTPARSGSDLLGMLSSDWGTTTEQDVVSGFAAYHSPAEACALLFQIAGGGSAPLEHGSIFEGLLPGGSGGLGVVTGDGGGGGGLLLGGNIMDSGAFPGTGLAGMEKRGAGAYGTTLVDHGGGRGGAVPGMGNSLFPGTSSEGKKFERSDPQTTIVPYNTNAHRLQTPQTGGPGSSLFGGGPAPAAAPHQTVGAVYRPV